MRLRTLVACLGGLLTLAAVPVFFSTAYHDAWWHETAMEVDATVVRTERVDYRDPYPDKRAFITEFDTGHGRLRIRSDEAAQTVPAGTRVKLKIHPSDVHWAGHNSPPGQDHLDAAVGTYLVLLLILIVIGVYASKFSIVIDDREKSGRQVPLPDSPTT